MLSTAWKCCVGSFEIENKKQRSHSEQEHEIGFRSRVSIGNRFNLKTKNRKQ
jgi:hypothetical protein